MREWLPYEYTLEQTAHLFQDDWSMSRLAFALEIGRMVGASEVRVAAHKGDAAYLSSSGTPNDLRADNPTELVWASMFSIDGAMIGITPEADYVTVFARPCAKRDADHQNHCFLTNERLRQAYMGATKSLGYRCSNHGMPEIDLDVLFIPLSDPLSFEKVATAIKAQLEVSRA